MIVSYERSFKIRKDQATRLEDLVKLDVVRPKRPFTAIHCTLSNQN